MESKIKFFVTWLSVAGIISFAMLTPLYAQTIDNNQNSPNNLLKGVAMTNGLLVHGKPFSGYQTTYKYTAAIAVAGGKRYVISRGVDYQGAEYDAKMTFLRDIRMKHDKKMFFIRLL